MDWAFTKGQRTSLVLSLICYDSQGNWHLLQSQDRRGYKLWVHGSIPHAGTIAGVDLLVTSEWPFVLAEGDWLVFGPRGFLCHCSPPWIYGGCWGWSEWTMGSSVFCLASGCFLFLWGPHGHCCAQEVVDTRTLPWSGLLRHSLSAALSFGRQVGHVRSEGTVPAQDSVCCLVVASGHFGPWVYPRSASRCSGTGTPPSVLCLHRISDDSNHPQAG